MVLGLASTVIGAVAYACSSGFQRRKPFYWGLGGHLEPVRWYVLHTLNSSTGMLRCSD
ncbi:hypothetical protein WOLCODRAFT_135713 [Wolfiporia cocos MD-104 SS10]|uniref:Uncharacterized protein n=1 Tax=Wolfiporia cocos (strain MD-104) TaxID=742152 RepID=A0A2H3IXI9_WOLCO|nr:hypothetical protein WOLCODRAFT_135713 [Wolfiporia cocos MD-104 SS10]